MKISLSFRNGFILATIALIFVSFSKPNLNLYLPSSNNTSKETQSSLLSELQNSTKGWVDPNIMLRSNHSIDVSSRNATETSPNSSSTATLSAETSQQDHHLNHRPIHNLKTHHHSKQQAQQNQHYHHPVVNISIVVQLSGELGNHLSKVAFGYAIQCLLKESYGITSHLVLQHQERGSKWEIARHDLQQCFPFFRNLDFAVANTPEFYKLQSRQQQTPNFDSKAFVFPISISMNETIQRLDTIAYILKSTTMNHHENINRTDATISNITLDNNGNISFPFIHVNEFIGFHLLDRYYNQLQNLFVFDRYACCAELPYEDEAVFHFRNFVGEMPRKGKRKGYEELSPNQTVDELFGHLPSGSNTKIAMTSRSHANDPLIHEYTKAFDRRGFQWRVITNQTGVEAFCFLKSTQYELAGIARSTFVQWAAILGERTNNTTHQRISRLYSIDSNYTRNALGDQALIQYNWTYHPELQNAIRFVHFSAP